VDEVYFQAIRAFTFAAALALALTLQRLHPHTGARRSARTNIGLWLVDGLVTGIICGGCVCTAANWTARNDVGLLNALAAPIWVAVPATVVTLDLLSYTWHRANHVLRPLWRLHQVHHSDPSFTVSTALRFHPGELVLSLPARLLVVAFLGAPVTGVIVFEALFALANLFEHGNIDLPPGLERCAGAAFVTPALHRFHHTRVGRERDHNYGTILSLWDRVLGTYRGNTSSAHIDVGLTEVPNEVGVAGALLLPFRSVGRVS
jgi:sterol desaturase/sphingolipid hydroxylase (fatty acid hydroxylase superfamily)